MGFYTKFLTNNSCYRAGVQIAPKGIMIHSTATRGVMAGAWASIWDSPGIEVCAHACIDNVDVYQYLPWTMQGWHAGQPANNTHIGIELCEPKVLTDPAYFKGVWYNAVTQTAKLCKQFNLTEKDVIGHAEGHKMGIATNHADPMHWFPLMGKTMDDFRKDVKSAMVENKPLEPWQIKQGTEALDSLNKDIVRNPEQWKLTLGEPVPQWLFWSIIARLTK